MTPLDPDGEIEAQLDEIFREAFGGKVFKYMLVRQAKSRLLEMLREARKSAKKELLSDIICHGDFGEDWAYICNWHLREEMRTNKRGKS